jgi:predicted O-methyltransferase YrrM
MSSSLRSPRVRAVLERLFAAADHDDERRREIDGADFGAATADERADLLQAVYMPVSAQGGELIYSLVRASRPDVVVEFGTSFGISTLHLAAAIADAGHGQLFTTELSATKIEAARANLEEAGLAEFVTFLAGDALETLAAVPSPIGFVFLDGWKDLCLPVLRLLEPGIRPGALVAADDSSFSSMSDYLSYVRDPERGYVSVSFPIEDGIEVSCRT